MISDKIEITRDTQSFYASFCLVKESFYNIENKTCLLHKEEIAYYQSLKASRRKHSYLLGRIAAKNALIDLLGTGKCEDIYIGTGVFQYPVIYYDLANNVQVSISHCNDFGIAMVYPENHPLGVDIEKINLPDLDAMKTQISDRELVFFGDLELSLLQGCTILWTVKESLSKILKVGMTNGLHLFEVDEVKKEKGFYISTFRSFYQYKAISFIAGDYACSIAAPKNSSVNLSSFLDAFNKISLIKQDGVQTSKLSQ
ncbi:4'-phosphopantetheinyl transferase superfamily protein [Mucilaginibacter rubeus]|uniref:4'-phosphopantetheinyl transferase superfamily protein n=1 Tax=Mucilaginibacter rubeus TaxID=2027860 RepID=A0AAE6MGS2_9SPHI|nr:MULTISPECIES: 4'-phosphopantetheinyl transferase superfamily protein [Mucilaginibacter]QEM02509.1 4'-phosphopantetheinyl transferase superfamily protein [Mucilaginibacter rubeus]QEM15129.1 4'-phosphopantetheinyl transferase superfamily protein [Mucilaginibacter gossypii]QTE42148.1 4'-phosphopantetheinyl transferase superfamily protein [Mucilaginibacter rubeus]QTE48749.1 4'-phosphopantetheinyl transferase superfamily protein [Mucilaginibacter rubeus]QTE53847.1 4'-phosphopantetheinyl transfer